VSVEAQRVSPATGGLRAAGTAIGVLGSLSFCHLLNDLLQSMLPAVYPILKSNLRLDFAQIGLITFVNSGTASLLQPLVGAYTDRRPQPFSLAAGMTATLMGVLLLASAGRFALVLIAAALIGIGSSIFHPESSRIARLASGGRHGFAQSLFQVGGNVGSSIGPLLAAFIVLPNGQSSLVWFSAVALLGIALLWQVGRWYREQQRLQAPRAGTRHDAAPLTPQVKRALTLIIVLLFSKYVYLASLTSYYTFYLIGRFNVSVQVAQLHLFLFLGAVAAGTMIGGPVGDRIGRRRVILWSILGVLPFTLALPYANLFWTRLLSVGIGLVLASALSAIVVYAQELLPGRVGTVAGLLFGFAFGIAGIGAAAIGQLADVTSLAFVYRLCAFLPALGAVAFWLPRVGEPHALQS
jgi:FSR family fosmidomycin resistance protein-like MFS transporter